MPDPEEARSGAPGSIRPRFYFVRHGESEANLTTEFSNRPGVHPLTETGRAQAFALAGTLRGCSVGSVYSSPILRAVQTAEILSSELKVPFTIEDALREFDVGVLEGKSDTASWGVFWQVLDAWVKRGEWDRRIEGGESFNDIRKRFVPFIEELLPRRAGGVVLVGHGGTYRCMLPLVFKNVDFAFAAEHGLEATGMVVGELRAEGLVCLSWGDIRLSA